VGAGRACRAVGRAVGWAMGCAVGWVMGRAVSRSGAAGLLRVFVVSFGGTWAWALPGLAQAALGRSEVFAAQAAAVFAAAALGALTFPLVAGRLGSRVTCRSGAALASLGALMPLIPSASLVLAGVGAFVVSLGTWVTYLSMKGLLYRHLPPSARPWVPTVFDVSTLLALAGSGVGAALAPLPPAVPVVGALSVVVAMLAAGWSAGELFGGVAPRRGPVSSWSTAGLAGGWAMLPFAAAFALVGGVAEAAPAVAAAANGAWATVAAVGMGLGIAVAPVLTLVLLPRPWLIRVAVVAAVSLYLLPLSAPVVLAASAATMAVAQIGFLLGDLASARLDDGSGSGASGASAAWYLSAAPATALAAVQMPSVWVAVLAVLAVVALPLRRVRGAFAGFGGHAPAE
jgi:hypothetical protein